MTFQEIQDPQAFAEMWASDEIAEANDPSYRAPDGELFRIAYKRNDGTVVADSGRWFAAEEFRECKRVVG